MHIHGQNIEILVLTLAMRILTTVPSIVNLFGGGGGGNKNMNKNKDNLLYCNKELYLNEGEGKLYLVTRTKDK